MYRRLLLKKKTVSRNVFIAQLPFNRTRRVAVLLLSVAVPAFRNRTSHTSMARFKFQFCCCRRLDEFFFISPIRRRSVVSHSAGKSRRLFSSHCLGLSLALCLFFLLVGRIIPVCKQNNERNGVERKSANHICCGTSNQMIAHFAIVPAQM